MGADVTNKHLLTCREKDVSTGLSPERDARP